MDRETQHLLRVVILWLTMLCTLLTGCVVADVLSRLIVR